jgi:hypothetical protein
VYQEWKPVLAVLPFPPFESDLRSRLLVPSRFRDALIRAHYPVLQSLCAAIVAVAVVHYIFDFTWQRSIGLACATVLGYWLGQALHTYMERKPGQPTLD